MGYVNDLIRYAAKKNNIDLKGILETISEGKIKTEKEALLSASRICIIVRDFLTLHLA